MLLSQRLNVDGDGAVIVNGGVTASSSELFDPGNMAQDIHTFYQLLVSHTISDPARGCSSKSTILFARGTAFAELH